jgi:hypothetical protein
MSNPVTYHGKELRSIKASTTIFFANKNHGVNFSKRRSCSSITGLELITNCGLSELLSKYFNKSIQCVDKHLSEYSSNLKQSGTVQWSVKDLVSMQLAIATGDEEKTETWNSNDFERICKHPPAHHLMKADKKWKDYEKAT